MKRIWKFQLEYHNESTISMPKGAKVLSVQLQRNAICIWALCDADAEPENRRFVICGTGHLINPINWEYVGTVQDGAYVWHIFEVLK